MPVPDREMFKPRKPRDRTPYPRHSRSRPLSLRIRAGTYAFVRDTIGKIHVVPDELHVHPKILGEGQSATFAGDMTLDSRGRITSLTNLSGTFRFWSKRGLLAVAVEIEELGFRIQDSAVRYFPSSGARPVVLR